MIVVAGAIPVDGASAVAMNVTVVNPTERGFLTIAPDDGTALPVVSNLNYVAGQTVANLVVVQLRGSGRVRIFSSAGNPHIIIDSEGWFADGSGRLQLGGTFHPLDPTRVLDTRTSSPLGVGGKLEVAVNGVGEIPTEHVAAVDQRHQGTRARERGDRDTVVPPFHDCAIAPIGTVDSLFIDHANNALMPRRNIDGIASCADDGRKTLVACRNDFDAINSFDDDCSARHGVKHGR